VRKPARKSGDDLPVARTNVLVWYARSGLKLSGFRERVAYIHPVQLFLHSFIGKSAYLMQALTIAG
ncbi:MAG: hypothetical protein ACYTX0_12630, partial [Nostoc sp.]